MIMDCVVNQSLRQAPFWRLSAAEMTNDPIITYQCPKGFNHGHKVIGLVLGCNLFNQDSFRPWQSFTQLSPEPRFLATLRDCNK